MKTRYAVRDGVVVAEALPDPDFTALEAAVVAAAVATAGKPTEDLVDSAGHRIGNYL